MGILVKHTKKHPSGRIEYRRAFPQALRPAIAVRVGKSVREHKVTLGREGTPGFLSRHEAADAEYDAIVSAARRAHSGQFDTLDAPMIAYLAKVFEVGLHTYEEAQLKAEGADWVNKAAHGWEVMLDDYRLWRIERDFDAMVEQWGGTASALLADKGIQLAPDDRRSLRLLCDELNNTVIRHSEPALKRLAGFPVPIPEAPEAPKNARAAQATLPLLALFDAYAVNMTPGVRSEWRKNMERLIAFIGHDDVRQLSTDDLMAWRDQLLAEPTRHGGLRDPVTVKGKYIGAVKAMLAWAVQERKLAENVAAAVNVSLPKKLKVRDRNFTDEEATAILKATLVPFPAGLSVEHARARRWIPWLCAYTGARVNEMSQLRREDVKQLDGFWMLHISPEAGAVKGGQGRTAPLHAHLIEQGFLAMVKACPGGPLFYDPGRQRVAGGVSRHFKKVGERLRDWVRGDVGITDAGIQPNHAWRHTFKTKAIEADIMPRVIDAIVGHAAKTVGDTYGSVTPRAKSNAIAKFPRFPVEAPSFPGDLQVSSERQTLTGTTDQPTGGRYAEGNEEQ